MRNRALAVLGIGVSRGNHKFKRSVHRKSTFSGVYTNYRSFIATQYKNSLIYKFLYRSFTIVSDYHKLRRKCKVEVSAKTNWIANTILG